MNDSIESLHRQIDTAQELEMVVRTMKALAASSVVQYEKAVLSLHDYYSTIQLALATYFKTQKNAFISTTYNRKPTYANFIVFGSDQGLVGQFNDQMAEYVLENLKSHPVKKRIWTVGERINIRLEDMGYSSIKNYQVPNSVNAITPLVTNVLLDIQSQKDSPGTPLLIFYHKQKIGSIYEPVHQVLLPIDQAWQEAMVQIKWPTDSFPELISKGVNSLLSFIHEYLFVTLFQACAHSLASENASRMVSMQRAEKNIGELLENLNLSYHRLRQDNIDEELFDVISGFEALTKKKE